MYILKVDVDVLVMHVHYVVNLAVINVGRCTWK